MFYFVKTLISNFKEMIKFVFEQNQKSLIKTKNVFMLTYN